MIRSIHALLSLWCNPYPKYETNQSPKGYRLVAKKHHPVTIGDRVMQQIPKSRQKFFADFLASQFHSQGIVISASPKTVDQDVIKRL